MVREQSVSLGHGRTRYLDAGRGRPVVLLHAFPLDADMWRPQLDDVSDGWRYVAPDLRGFGPSPTTPARSIDDLASGVLEFMDTLHLDRAVVGGLSMGGYVTFALLRRAPERLSALLLADTRATADNDQGKAGRTKMLEAVRMSGVGSVADEMLPKLLGAATRRDRPELEPRVRGLIERNSAEGVAGAIEALRDRPDSTALLPSISVPALLVVGEEDTLTPPSETESMHTRIRQSTVVVLPSAGHLSNLEAPVPFSNALANFLTTVL